MCICLYALNRSFHFVSAFARANIKAIAKKKLQNEDASLRKNYYTVHICLAETLDE